MKESWSFPASFFLFFEFDFLDFVSLLASVGHRPRFFIAFWSLSLLSVIPASYCNAGLSFIGEMSELVEVPITGILELFLFDATKTSFFMKWPESSFVVYSKSLNFLTIYRGNEDLFPIPLLTYGYSFELLFLAGVLRLKRRGILLAGPPLEIFDLSDVLSFAVLSPFDWQLKLDFDPTLKLLRSIPLRELCLFRFSFGFDC